MPLDLTRIRAVCFDVDGTLNDTDDLWVARLERALHPLQVLSPNWQMYSIARRIVMELESPGNLAYEVLDRLHLGALVARLFSAVSRSRNDNAGHFLLVPGVREMLIELHNRYPLAVVSAHGERSTFGFLEQFGLAQFFTAVATAQTCVHTKPLPDPLLWAAEKMGVLPEACLMVGDTTVDIRAGKAAGAQTVGVLCGFGTRRELIRAGADLILESTKDLTGALIC